jgi:hypothetical protein
MRRSIAVAVVTLATALSVVPASASSATDGVVPPLASLTGQGPQQDARSALERAQSVLAGTAPARPGSRVEGTLALRNLFASLPDLSTSQRREAHRMLARPTDGNRDPYGDGYTVPAKRKCDGHFCIHWVPTTSDAPPSKDWVNTTLATMNKVWHKEVDKLGYRKPVKDGRHGGNDLFDVYLKDVGADYLYGYCAPEYLKPGRKREASGYCVLDNDFDSSQFGGTPPMDSLRVTAAHEFFHAIQFGYDYKEDGWLMEATSTWIEERFADGINDNRQYLPYGQVRRPFSSLDTYDQQGFNQYGNWAFFEYLSSRFGNGLVRSIWHDAGEFPAGGKMYSTEAVAAALADHGGFPSVLSGFAAGNLAPARTYQEGGAWPSAVVSRHWTLAKDHLAAGTTLKVNHMAARNAVVKPDPALSGGRWHGRVVVNGPRRVTDPVVRVVVERTNGRTPVTKTVRLNRDGHGKTAFALSSRVVQRVTITVVNASTRFNCREHTSFSCHGKPKDNGRDFDLSVSAFKR